MAFEDLREQLKDRAAEAMSKLQETSAFNTLRERYESQTPPVQKAVVAGASLLMVLIVLMWPMSYISSSSDTLAKFEENRELIQGLLRSSRSANEPAPLPPPMDSSTLKSSVDGILRQNGLLPDQIGEMNPIPESEIKGLAPPGVVTNGLTVQLKKLNVMQLIEIGNLIQNMAPGTKLYGADIVQTAATTHYYDMTLQVVNFGLPPFDTGGDEPADSKKKPGKGKSKSSDAEME